MTSRERLLAALDHREPDRVPLDIGSTAVTGIHRDARASLRAHLGLPAREPVTWHRMQQLARVDDDLHSALGTDVRGVRCAAAAGWDAQETEDDGYRLYTDEFGIVRRMPRADGQYYDLCGSPLAGASGPADVAAYAWPRPDGDERFAGMREQCLAAREAGFPVVLGSVCSGMMEMGEAMLGFDRYFTELAANRPLVEALADRVLELKTRYWRAAMTQVSDLVDVVQEGDDYGGQRGLLVSPALWRAVFRPRLAALFAALRQAAPRVRVLFHSCGAIRPILPDLIEVGVDAINPVQVSAPGMEPSGLKRDFGADLTFWGGGVDTQSVLPRASPRQVREAALRSVEALAPGGGFVFAAVHNIQPDVPPANVLAMCSAVRDRG